MQFSLDLRMHARIYKDVYSPLYTGMVYRTRFEDHVDGLSHLATNKAAASTRV